jgi:hypothetical protein
MEWLWDFGFWKTYIWTLACNWFTLALAILGVNELSEWLFKKSIRWLHGHRGKTALLLIFVAQVAVYHELSVKPTPATPLAPIHVQLNEADPQAMRQIEDLKRELPNAPLKSRVATATARLEISVSPEVPKTFTNRKASDGKIAHVSFGKSKETVMDAGLVKQQPRPLRLASSAVEPWGNETTGTNYFMEFLPESYDPLNISESVGELLNGLDVVELDLRAMFPIGSEIQGGIVTLTLNASTRKKFTIPKIQTDIFGIFLVFKSETEPAAVVKYKVVELK